MRTTWNFSTAGQLVFGWGAVDQLGQLLLRRNLKRVLIVTDQQLVAAGLLDTVSRPLQQASIEFEVFDGGEAEPALEVVDSAIQVASQYQPDAILALGGGSNMDLSKITAVCIAHGGAPKDYFGFDKIPGPVLPLICVPTTAGTGSEVSHVTVLTDKVNQIKVSSQSSYLRPALAVVDPQLTISCPKHVTADSGIDALTHAIEAYTATDYDKLEVPQGELALPYEGKFPLGDIFAERAIQLVAKHLSTAVDQPDNREAREGMSLAATLAGMAFSNAGVAIVHGLEYPLGGALRCSHGAGNGLLLPHVMRFNLPKCCDSLARIASLMGQDVSGLSQEESAQRAIEAVQQLSIDIGIPQRIRDLGATPEQLPGFAEKTFAIKRLLAMNPRQASCDDLLGILQAAY